MSLQSVNRILLMGNLGHEPELRKTPKGNTVMTINVATNREVKNSGGESRTETHWHRATLWGRNAENAALVLRKGSRVFIEGELHMKSYADKEGVQRKSAEIYVDKWTLMHHPFGSNPAPVSAPEKPELALVH
jgi:single-strand DNA-binding protein